MVVQGSFDKDSEKIFSDLDRQKRGIGSCFSYKNLVFGFLFFLFAVLVLLGWGISATGLLRIPVIASLAYPEDPKPLRIVEPAESINESDFESKFNLSNQTSGQVEISENELTSLIRTPNAEGEVSIKQGQIAIDQNSAEIYGIVNATREKTVVIRIGLQEAEEDVIMESLRVGYLPMPKFLADGAIRTFAGENFISLKSAISSLFKNSESNEKVEVESVRLEHGKVIISVRKAS